MRERGLICCRAAVPLLLKQPSREREVAGFGHRGFEVADDLFGVRGFVVEEVDRGYHRLEFA